MGGRHLGAGGPSETHRVALEKGAVTRGPMPPITLNANQRRHFEVLFARLEDSLTKLEQALGERGASAVLTIMNDDVPPTFRASAALELPRIHAEIARLTLLLGLTPRVTSLRRTIGATLTAEAVRVEDSLSGQMRGYGAVDPSVGEQLDPVLTALAQSLRQLSAALNG